jgi:calcineurin-like phosphoesterase family protein
MNETLISNWNSIVSPHDTVYHLGDVGMGRPEELLKILKRLNGKIFLIRGNHDKAAEHRLCRDRFEWIKDYHFASFNGGIKIALCHYALRVWDRSHRGAWHFYGHSHGRLPPLPGSFALDLGVNSWDYSPVSLHRLRDIMLKAGWREKSDSENSFD